jgi:hypothetical protein
MMARVELHIVIDRGGVRGVQIIGPPDIHPEGHDLYFSIRDLVLQFDEAVQKRLREREEHRFEKGNEH